MTCQEFEHTLKTRDPLDVLPSERQAMRRHAIGCAACMKRLRPRIEKVAKETSLLEMLLWEALEIIDSEDPEA